GIRDRTVTGVQTCALPILATPAELVVAVLTPPANVPLGPLVGAANVTVTPATGLPKASFTVASKGLAKAVLMAAVCGVPPVAVKIGRASCRERVWCSVLAV